VDGDVFEQDLPLVRIGQQVRVEFRALPDAPRTGRVVSFEPTLDQTTRTARIRVALANPGGQLRPGMFATLHLVAPQPAATLVVPRSAVLSTGERSLVFVRREDGRLEPRQVTIGLSDDTQVQILRGLAHGDVVVASATFLVDAESNLGVAMSGMDMSAPKALDSKGAPAKAAPKQDSSAMDHSMHDMPAATPAAPPVRKPMQER
jgi:Cu(I)/Ag(I) efflux system membrane fusion protein